MSDDSVAESEAKRLGAMLARSRELRAEAVTKNGLDPRYAEVARFQSSRLARTYSDLHQQKRYAAAVEFFLSDLYGPHDFSERDQGIERIYPLMQKVLSEQALRSITLAIELHALSQELDHEMTQLLFPVGSPMRTIVADEYAEAFRRCGRPQDRERQVVLVLETGQALDAVVRKPAIYAAVRVARKPARVAGFGELQEFVERGLSAFRKMKGADEFLETVAARERRLFEQLYSGADSKEWYPDIPA